MRREYKREYRREYMREAEREGVHEGGRPTGVDGRGIATHQRWCRRHRDCGDHMIRVIRLC